MDVDDHYDDEDDDDNNELFFFTFILGLFQGSRWFQSPPKPTLASRMSRVNDGLIVAFPN